jgi:hypothetical protein
MKVSFDNGETFIDAPQGILVIQELEQIPGEDGSGELHLSFTGEGIITDLWVSREEPLDHNLGTMSQTYDELAEQLIE